MDDLGDNISFVYCGGVLIQPFIKRLRDDTEAGVAAYVMIMFGMTVILYLFGFTNIWNNYVEITLGGAGTDTVITNSAVGFGTNVLTIISDIIAKAPENIALATGGVLATVGLFIVGKLTGATSTILQYLIPLLLLIILNIFVFPLSGISADLGFLDATGTAVTIFLFAFFNLFYILAIIEFIRGTPT